MRALAIACVLATAGGLALLGCSGDEDSSGRGRTNNPIQVAGTSGGTAGTGAMAGTGAISNGGVAGTSAVPMTAGTGSMQPREICEVVHATANPTTPDMLIVLDRSGSMTDGGRWVPSVSALRRVTMELQSQIRFGLAMFPDPSSSPTNVITDITMCFAAPDPQACLDQLTGGNGNNPACAPGSMVVPVAIDNATAIGQALDQTIPGGGTPTGQTLQSLVGTFGAPPMDPDAIPSPKFVLLVTDGQPTCPAGNGRDTTQADIDLANTAIEALTAAGVHTYVIGYDTSGPGNENLASVLDGFAQRGGTGDTQHRPVEDEASLLAELQRIAGDIVSCNFTLDQAPPRPDYVLVRLDGQQINLGDPNGWQLVGDRNVQLMGTACETLKSGGPHMVTVEVRCSVVTPE